MRDIVTPCMLGKTARMSTLVGERNPLSGMLILTSPLQFCGFRVLRVCKFRVYMVITFTSLIFSLSCFPDGLFFIIQATAHRTPDGSGHRLASNRQVVENRQRRCRKHQIVVSPGKGRYTRDVGERECGEKAAFTRSPTPHFLCCRDSGLAVMIRPTDQGSVNTWTRLPRVFFFFVSLTLVVAKTTFPRSRTHQLSHFHEHLHLHFKRSCSTFFNKRNPWYYVVACGGTAVDATSWWP